jgi:hypothetical protein
MNDYGREVRFISFILHGSLNSGAESRLVCILWRIATTPNHLFTSFNANQPFRLDRVSDQPEFLYLFQ